MRAQHHPRLGSSRCRILFRFRAFQALSESQAPPPTPGTRQASARPISFDVDIRPILAENCFACHGPDEKQRKAKLHFDTARRRLLAGQCHRPRQYGARAC
jgi:hypothetical protein